MKLVIVIDGDSADDLFAVGVKDLMEHFLPKKLFVKTKDITRCWFEEISDEEALWKGEKYTVTKHKDNFIRRKQ